MGALLKRDLQQEEMTRLGFYGLTPFVAAAVVLWLSPFVVPLHIALDFHQFALVYGGVIAAYLAGIGAGSMLHPKLNQPRGFLPSMLAALAAVIMILPSGTFIFTIGAAWRHFVILMILIYLLLRDLSAVDAGLLPRWYGELRSRLTFWASVSIALIASRLTLLGYY
jgi:hypothetical protein